MNNLPELLSPAGDREALEMAVAYGCDAVYLAAHSYGMRSAAKNFDTDELADAVRFAHDAGVSVYLTCNTVPTNDEAAAYPAFISAAADTGIDAAIVADIGVLTMTKKYAPALDIHMSTQTGVMNYETAAALYDLGAKRVVLARETSLEDIRRIREKIPRELEIEVFVHGAMCVSFSGRCLLSKYLTGRDANRGECAQPCRWKYTLTEETRPDEHYPIYQDERGSYILNSMDLCMIEHLPELIDAGVSSLKIEGRAKSGYYSATITGAYRRALSYAAQGKPVPEAVLQEVMKVSHRPYCTGFFYDRDDARQNTAQGGYIREYDFAAVINGYEDGMLDVTHRNYFTLDDALEVISPGGDPVRFTPDTMINSKGESVRIANHAMEALKIPYPVAFPKNSIIRKAL